MKLEQVILNKIKKIIPDNKTFEARIIRHVDNTHFPLIYKCLYKRFMLHGRTKFTTVKFKRLLKHNYLYVLNDIYRTRLSEGAFNIIIRRIDDIDFENYRESLGIFIKCNPRKNRKIPTDALSLGTKALHTFNPEVNPILDSRIRKNLGIKENLDIELCVAFKNAMNQFVNGNSDFFSLFKESPKIKKKFLEYNIEIEFPKMKILDMAILG